MRIFKGAKCFFFLFSALFSFFKVTEYLTFRKAWDIIIIRVSIGAIQMEDEIACSKVNGTRYFTAIINRASRGADSAINAVFR